MKVTGRFSNVVDKVKVAGLLSLYNGALAVALGTFVGHYPWFFVYNFLSEAVPEQETPLMKLAWRALLGFCSSAVSDTCSNWIRVLKVYKQSDPDQLTYIQVLMKVIAESGVTGLFFGGLETKILANGLQAILFSILWKYFEKVLFPKQKKTKKLWHLHKDGRRKEGRKKGTHRWQLWWQGGGIGKLTWLN